MFGRETRMLLRHYLEHGTSKSALARQLGVSRDTIHRWIRAGDLDRDLDDEPVRYGPRPPVPTKLDAYKADHRDAPGGVSRAVGGAPARRDPRRRLCRRLLAAESVRAPGAADAAAASRSSASRRRRAAKRKSISRTSRFPWGVRYALLVVLGLLAAAVVPVLSAPGHGHADRRARGRVPLFRRRPAGAALRSDEGGDHARPAARGRRARPQSRVSPLRASLGLHAARVPSLSRADQRQSRAAGPLPARQFRLRPHVSARCRSRSAAPALARARRQCAAARHHARAPARALRSRGALPAAAAAPRAATPR